MVRKVWTNCPYISIIYSITFVTDGVPVHKPQIAKDQSSDPQEWQIQDDKNKLNYDRREGLPKEPDLDLALKNTQLGSQANFWG